MDKVIVAKGYLAFAMKFKRNFREQSILWGLRDFYLDPYMRRHL